MGAVPAELQARLDSGATTLARCWKVTRADGVVLGFTDHDRDLTVEDTRYLASTGVTASALEAATGLSVDNAEATGALSAAGLTEGDILAGRYDGAEVEQFLVDWERPDLWKRIFRGTLGDIEQEGGLFRAELRSLAEGLNRPVGRAFVRVCECTLGDAKCGFDLGAAGYAAEATVAGVTDNRRLRLTGAEGPLAGWFTGGSGRLGLWRQCGAAGGCQTRRRRRTGAGGRALAAGRGDGRGGRSDPAGGGL